MRFMLNDIEIFKSVNVATIGDKIEFDNIRYVVKDISRAYKYEAFCRSVVQKDSIAHLEFKQKCY